MSDEAPVEQAPASVEEWLERHGSALDPKARAELERLKLGVQVEKPDEKPKEDVLSWSERFKQGVYKAMKWTGIIAVGAAVVGGAAYVGKQAADSFPTAVKSSASRELEERTGAVKEAISDLESASGILLMKLLDFMIALKDKGSTWEGVSGMAVTAWSGMWSDAKEYLASGEKSPDKTLAKMKEIVTSDPALSGKMDEIFTAYDNLKGKKEALEHLASTITTVTDEDTRQFLGDWKGKFWEEMRGKGEQLKVE